MPVTWPFTQFSQVSLVLNFIISDVVKSTERDKENYMFVLCLWITISFASDSRAPWSWKEEAHQDLQVVPEVAQHEFWQGGNNTVHLWPLTWWRPDDTYKWRSHRKRFIVTQLTLPCLQFLSHEKHLLFDEEKCRNVSIFFVITFVFVFYPLQPQLLDSS